jgi:hypothetical protein
MGSKYKYEGGENRYKKADLHEEKTTRSAHDKWHDIAPENLWKMVSLLTMCRKGKQGGDDGRERKQRGWVMPDFPFIF